MHSSGLAMMVCRAAKLRLCSSRLKKREARKAKVAIVYADIGNARSAGEVVAYIAHGKEIGFCHHGAEQAFAWSLQKFGKRDAQFHAQIVDDLGGGVADFTVLLQKVVIPAVGERGGALADVFVQISRCSR